jgi:predicted small metal-binding protein
MKTLTCEQMGGPCASPLTGATPEEMMEHGWKHMEEAHPDMATEMAALPQEAKDDWEKGFRAKWDATPEDE